MPPSLSATGHARASELPGLAFFTFTVDALSYTPSTDQAARDLAQAKATGRRRWKTVKNQPEAVWPPAVEAALIEALEKFQPTAGKNGPRFPQRNHFISKYIFEKTGKHRRHKQVGSRLQQLRDTHEDSRIFSLISKGSVPDLQVDVDEESSIEQTVPPCRHSSSAFSDRDFADNEKCDLFVFSLIVMQATQSWGPIPRLHLVANDLQNPTMLHLSCQPRPLSTQPQFSFSPLLSSFSNIIQLFTAYFLEEETQFVVYKGGQLVGKQIAHLRRRMTGNESFHGFVYECALASSFWSIISESSDLNQITIVQSVIPSISSLVHVPDPIPRRVIIVYHFESPAISSRNDLASQVREDRSHVQLPPLPHANSHPSTVGDHRYTYLTSANLAARGYYDAPGSQQSTQANPPTNYNHCRHLMYIPMGQGCPRG